MISVQRITSFDKTQEQVCSCVRPEKYDDLFRLKGKALVARGAGLSYCNAGTSDNALVVDMRRMNRIIGFDADNGTIEAEAGITIGELNSFAIAHGWIIPVLPGYPTITLGGCIAFNIHGKSQYKVGTFGDWVNRITLFHPATGETTCSNDLNNELFSLTIGGFGLTGIILTANIRLKKLPHQGMQVERHFVAGINEAVNVMKEYSDQFEYVYSWNNFNAKGKHFGKGVVYFEKYVAGTDKPIHYKNRMAPGYRLPAIQNDLFVKLMCSTYYLLESMKSKKYIAGVTAGSFPIYGKEIYFHLFGKKGFREYQVLFPFDKWAAAADAIRELIAKMKIVVALGSLKLFSGPAHFLSFAGEGVCITIDVQESKHAIVFFEKMDELTVQYNGIVNLSKDSRINGTTVSTLFPEYESFRAGIYHADPGNFMQSSLKTRLNLGQ